MHYLQLALCCIAAFVGAVLSGFCFAVVFYATLTIDSATPLTDLATIKLLLLVSGVALFACVVWLVAFLVVRHAEFKRAQGRPYRSASKREAWADLSKAYRRSKAHPRRF